MIFDESEHMQNWEMMSWDSIRNSGMLGMGMFVGIVILILSIILLLFLLNKKKGETLPQVIIEEKVITNQKNLEDNFQKQQATYNSPIYCGNCGTLQIDSNAEYCFECGSPLI